MLGVIGGTAEWIFAFPDRISVTVSGAAAIVDRNRDDLAQLLWRDIARVYSLAAPPPPCRIVKERRATFAATPEQNAQATRSNDPMAQPLPRRRLDRHGPSGDDRGLGPSPHAAKGPVQQGSPAKPQRTVMSLGIDISAIGLPPSLLTGTDRSSPPDIMARSGASPMQKPPSAPALTSKRCPDAQVLSDLAHADAALTHTKPGPQSQPLLQLQLTVSRQPKVNAAVRIRIVRMSLTTPPERRSPKSVATPVSASWHRRQTR